MSSIANYQPIKENVLLRAQNDEGDLQNLFLDSFLNGDSYRTGLLNNTEHIYNFSNVLIKSVYNLEIALEDFLTSPEVARQFLIYKVRPKDIKLLYKADLEDSTSEWNPVTENDAILSIFTEEIQDPDETLSGSIITEDNIIMYYQIITVTINNFQIQLNEQEAHYYKYNENLDDFEEIIVERETQLGQGFLDKYLDINEQAINIQEIENIVNNRRSIIAVSNNGEPNLNDYNNNIEFDTGSLWFIKTI